MKKLLFILLCFFAISAKSQLVSFVLRNDTLFAVNPSSGEWRQITKFVPAQAGQSGKVLSTNGATYEWITPSAGGGLPTDTSTDINNRIAANLQRLLDSLSNHISKIDGKQAGITQGTTAQYLKGNLTLGTYIGHTINVQALTSSPADAQTVYFGMLPKAPTTTANTSKVYVRQAGTITAAEIYCYSGTAGTNESWSLYIRVNNTTDYLIATVAAATSERVFTNSSLSISLAAGDYFEIKGIQPTWVTNPLTCIYGGYIKLN